MGASRRRFLRRLVAVAAGGAAGCAGSRSGRSTDTADGTADVIAGPDRELRFDPETLSVAAGERVTWRFASENHNVCLVPEHHPEVELPAGAEPFSSYEGDDKHATEPVGATVSHAFETPGTYVYVCIPHANHGMVGTIEVDG